MSSLNIGHGHIYPRPDGVRARCGGPGICNECSRDAAAVAAGAVKAVLAQIPPSSTERPILVPCPKCRKMVPECGLPRSCYYGESVSSKEQGPLWTPTLAVERLMRQCKGLDIIEVSAKVLEGLLFDVLQWRRERIEQRSTAAEPPSPQAPIARVTTETIAHLQWKNGLPYSNGVLLTYDELAERLCAHETKAEPVCGWGGAYGRCVLEPDHDGPHDIPRRAEKTPETKARKMFCPPLTPVKCVNCQEEWSRHEGDSRFCPTSGEPT